MFMDEAEKLFSGYIYINLSMIPLNRGGMQLQIGNEKSVDF